jgi:PAS domain S-box-containing protein
MNSILRILFVEDYISDAELIWREIEKNKIAFEKLLVDNRKDFLKGLKSFHPDIIISDYSLPQFDGMTALRLRNKLTPLIPFILVTGSINEEVAVECMKAGADDYILKDNLSRLGPAVVNSVKKIALLKQKKDAETALLESEEKFRSLMENSADAIFLADRQGKFVYVNKAVTEMLGYTSEEMKSKTFIDFALKNSADEYLEIFKQIQIEGKVFTEIELRKKDGNFVSTDLNSVLLPGGLVYGSCRDITERKVAEEILIFNEKRYHNIFENIQDVYYETSIDGMILEVSPSIAILSKGRYQRDDLIGESMYKLYSDPGVRQSFLTALKEHGSVNGFEITLDSKDDLPVFCSIAAKISFDTQGRPERIIGSMHDISLRKRAEERIQRDRIMLRTLIDNIPAMIYVKDIECRKVIANVADVKNIGYDREEEVIGKTDLELFPGQTGLRGYADDQKVLSSGKTIIGREEDFIDKNDVRRWLLTTKIPLRDKDGKITGLVGVGHDITERKENEAELILAKEKAEESDRLKTAFLNNISHEIRTPLNAIVGFASVLGNSELPADKKKEFVDIINVSNDQLLSIISGILSLATLEAGQEQINEEETDINQLLLNVYEQFLISHISAEVTLSYHPEMPDDQAFVYTDPVKLMQILVNLVENALKFTQKGKVRFGYTLTGNNLQFFVEDTGIGIPEEMHEYIFERFRQVDNSATRKYGGTGLGLALSKGYVELLGGSMKLTSKSGKGSIFSFTLPYKPVIKTRSDAIADSRVTDITFPPEKTILVAEDENNNFLLISELLTSLKLKVIRAQNGLEAVNICASGNLPDLILMDVKMPVMDGIEAAKLIKENNPGLPIIALTAYAPEVDKKSIQGSGCDAYLEKPIKQQLLYDRLVTYLTD